MSRACIHSNRRASISGKQNCPNASARQHGAQGIGGRRAQSGGLRRPICTTTSTAPDGTSQVGATGPGAQGITDLATERRLRPRSIARAPSTGARRTYPSGIREDQVGAPGPGAQGNPDLATEKRPRPRNIARAPVRREFQTWRQRDQRSGLISGSFGRWAMRPAGPYTMGLVVPIVHTVP